MNHAEIKSILVTGGAGFIGSNFVRHVMREGYETVIVLDKLTYAGNLANLADVLDDTRLRFVHGDICDGELLFELARDVDAVVNFAAETHVDRSLVNAGEFIQTDVYGVYIILEAVRRFGLQRFVHVSTDEVYGHVPDGLSVESDPLVPRNPYSASKAGGELMIQSYVESHGSPAIVTRGSNTYGPYQYPEKVLPISITNILLGKPIAIYGDGQQVRDWLHVQDHVEGIEFVMLHGDPGQAYNLGGGNQRRNLEIATTVLRELDAPDDLLHFVTDRQGHDRRYALDTTKVRALGWKPRIVLEDGLRETISWYRDNREWWEPIRNSDEYQQYFEQNYGSREVLKVGQC
ncbi:MAG: dTDP-glucose 4,6-dehydratase [Thermomicrobiales bacterium]